MDECFISRSMNLNGAWAWTGTRIEPKTVTGNRLMGPFLVPGPTREWDQDWNYISRKKKKVQNNAQDCSRSSDILTHYNPEKKSKLEIMHTRGGFF
jgi:hypothetical protein